MAKLYFNVDLITKIYLYESKKCYEYFWQEPIEIKSWFGLIKTGKFTKTGFYLSYPYINTEKGEGFVDVSELDSKEYVVKDNVVYYKPNIVIYLTDDSRIQQFFDTIDDANSYIDSIKLMSKSNFAVLIK